MLFFKRLLLHNHGSRAARRRQFPSSIDLGAIDEDEDTVERSVVLLACRT